MRGNEANVVDRCRRICTKRTFVALFVALAISVFAAVPGIAQEGTPTAEERVSRSFLFHPADTGLLSVFDVEIEAGGSADLTVLIGNNGSVAQDLRVYTVNVQTGEAGGISAGEYGSEPNAVSQWVSFPEEVVSLEPGSGIERTFTVNVPEGTPPGEYVAAVAGEHADALDIEGNSSFRQRLRYVTPIYITVPGDMTAEFGLGDPELVVEEDVMLIHIPVNNTGDMHVYPEGQVILRDGSNNILATIPVSMDIVFAGESATITLGISGGLPAGEYQLEGSFQDSDTGASAVLEQARFEAEVAATPEPEQFRIVAASVTAGPTDGDVQFVNVTAGIVNQGDPAVGMQLSLIAFLDGEEVERFPINQSLSLPTGETPITTRYIPSTGFTAGTWTFELLLETVEPNGTAIVVARAPIEGTIVVND